MTENLGTPTSAKPQVIAGVTFRSYYLGITSGRCVWRSEDGRCEVGRHYNTDMYYYAAVDGSSIPGSNRHIAKRFRTQSAAMIAAVFAAEAKDRAAAKAARKSEGVS